MGTMTVLNQTMIPEQKLLYELITLMKTDTCVDGRKLFHNSILNVMKDLTTKIERKKLENSMNVVQHTAADELLSIIKQVHKTSIDPMPEENDENEELEYDDNEPVDEDEIMVDERTPLDNLADWSKVAGLNQKQSWALLNCFQSHLSLEMYSMD